MDQWVPEIMYEESGEGVSSNIPFIMVPNNEEMPSLVYIFESRETGEVEPGLDGEDVPVVQWDLHQYADMAVLKEKLPENVFDLVRASLGLEPLKTAVEKGRAITAKVRSNIDDA